MLQKQGTKTVLKEMHSIQYRQHTLDFSITSVNVIKSHWSFSLSIEHMHDEKRYIYLGYIFNTQFFKFFSFRASPQNLFVMGMTRRMIPALQNIQHLSVKAYCIILNVAEPKVHCSKSESPSLQYMSHTALNTAQVFPRRSCFSLSLVMFLLNSW